MPRFELTPRQAAEIVAYLQRVGTAADVAPGVTETTVRVALVARNEAEAQPLADAASVCLREANAGDGIYGRRIEWTVWTADRLRDEHDWRQLRDQSTLVLAPLWPGQETLDRFSRWAVRERLTVVAPIGSPMDDPMKTPTTFRVAADPAVAWQVALDHLASAAGKAPIAVVTTDDAAARHALRALREQAARHPGLQLHELPAAELPRAAPQLASLRPAAVFVLGGPAEVAAAGAALAAAGSDAAVPLVGWYGSVGRAAFGLPATTRARLRLVHSHPLDNEFQPQPMLQAFERQGLKLTRPAVQSTAYAGGCLAAEALRRAGRRLTHAALQQGLESVRDFRTGVTMPLTYGVRQRHGVWGARLVRIEGESLVAVTPWTTPASHAP
jgi:branched-chain amino acid transport system substrate-binding protein